MNTKNRICTSHHEKYVNLPLGLFLLFALLSSANALSMEHSLIIQEEAKEEITDLSRREKFIKWLHNRHSDRDLGLDDPRSPGFVKFKPIYVPLPFEQNIPKEFIIKDSLDLQSLRPQILEKLAPKALEALLAYLLTVPVKMKWSDKEGHTQSGKNRKHRARLSHWDESNAAVALMLRWATESQTDLFISSFALIPEAILPAFQGHMLALLDPIVTAQIIGALLMQLDQPVPGASARVAKVIGALVEQGLSYWVATDITKLNPYLRMLSEESVAFIDHAKPACPEQVFGLLLGSVMAGTMKHVIAIKKHDEKCIWIVGVVSNMVWAASSFIACAPLAAPVAAATMGGVSIGSVLATTVYTALEFPRDYSPSIKEIEGRLQLAALEEKRFKPIDSKVNLLFELQWMTAAIRANGLND